MEHLNIHGTGLVGVIVVKRVKLLGDETVYYRTNRLGTIIRQRIVKRFNGLVQPETKTFVVDPWCPRKAKNLVNRDIKLARKGLS